MSTTTTWIRSSYCANGTCVEVAEVGDGIAVRDGKDRQGPVLTVSREDWDGFLAGIRAGHFPA